MAEAAEKKSVEAPRMKVKKTDYPFTAIVGQDVLKRALILNVVNPGVGGVLIRGEKGTGKSIAVRALSDILPEIEIVKGCKYNCDPKKPDKFCNDCKALQEKGELFAEEFDKLRSSAHMLSSGAAV